MVEGELPTNSADREPLTKLQREMENEGGLVTCNSMHAPFGEGSALPLAYRLRDQRRGVYARILDPTLEEVDRDKDPRMVFQIQAYLATLRNPRLDPRFSTHYPISEKDVRSWVNFVLDSRVMVWIWEYVIYKKIKKML